jgi:5'-3' exoribonuclease 2
LSNKFPKIVTPCKEEQPKKVKGVIVPIDPTKPNPNGEEYDNLYLDMNAIIHPCCHPENKVK